MLLLFKTKFKFKYIICISIRWGLGIITQTTQTPIVVKEGWFIEHLTTDQLVRATSQTLESTVTLHQDPIGLFKSEITNICAKIFTHQDLGMGVSLGTCQSPFF